MGVSRAVCRSLIIIDVIYYDDDDDDGRDHCVAVSSDDRHEQVPLY